MKSSHAPLLVAVLISGWVSGCGGPAVEIAVIPDPCVSVIGFDGEKTSIPSGQLYVQGSGEPTVDRVLVLDRATKRQLYVDMEQLAGASQARSRYLLVTESPCQPDE